MRGHGLTCGAFRRSTARLHVEALLGQVYALGDVLDGDRSDAALADELLAGSFMLDQLALTVLGARSSVVPRDEASRPILTRIRINFTLRTLTRCRVNIGTEELS